jgi:crotonobetainyl-CoA:carnitine CoA-transferase CaiB-like acyl-CoA transferase
MVFVLPLAVTPLAALGADVIKIEAASRPDQVRWGPPPDNQPRRDAYNHGANFQMLNRDKRGVTIDLTLPQGRDLLLKLVAVSDVVAENFTPRVLENLGLTYERLREVNERIILLSSTGFGQTGPWRHYRAYGPNTEAVDGLMELTGYPDGPPVRGGAGGLGVAFTDVAGAYFGSFAILAALEYRQRTGEGQWLDLSHYEAGVATIPQAVLDYTMNGRARSRTGNRHEWRAPQGVYPCAGAGDSSSAASISRVQPAGDPGASQTTNDRWIAISVAGQRAFAALCRVLGLRDASDDPRFATLLARRRNHDALDLLIGSATREREADELVAALQAAGVEATPVAAPRDVWLDPQLRHRGFFEMVPSAASAPEVGTRPHLRRGWKMSASRVATRARAPEFGQHNANVFGELLGLTSSEVDGLRAAGVIAAEPREGLLARPSSLDLTAMLSNGRLREIDPGYRERLDAWLAGTTQAGAPNAENGNQGTA